MIKALLKLISIIILAFGVVGGAIYYLTKTESGLQLIFNTVTTLIPGKLSADEIHGQLSGSINIKRLCYQNKQQKISIKQLDFSWQPLALLNNQLHIIKLRANEILLQTNSKTNRSNKKSASTDWQQLTNQYHLPINLTLDDIQLTKIILQIGTEKPSAIDSVTLRTQLANQGIEKLFAELRAPNTQLSIKGQLQQTWQLKWSMQITKLATLFPKAKGTISSTGLITGSRSSPKINATIDANNLSFNKLSLVKLHSKLDLGLADNTSFQSILAIDHLQYEDVGINHLELRGALNNSFPKTHRLAIQVQPILITLPKNHRASSILLHNGIIKIVTDTRGLQLEANLTPATYNPIKFTLSLPKYSILTWPVPEQKIFGKLNWQTNDIADLQSFLPQIKQLQGQLATELTLNGTIYQPQINGQILIKNASAAIPKSNLQLKNIQLNSHGNQNRFDYQITATSGAGNLLVTGITQIVYPNFPSTIKITGNNFLLCNTEEYQATINPKLELQLQGDQLNITGKIDIPDANIQPRNYGDVVTLPNEVVFVKKKASVSKALTPKIQSHVLLTLGEKVKFNVMNLSGHATGNLTVTDSPDRPTTAVGTLKISDGVYDAYGQKLSVTKGELYFQGGEITNPLLNIAATRHFLALASYHNQELTVGVKVTGTADDPQITLFSIPSGIPQTDILSYLILGQPSAEASKNSAALLVKAATAMNIGGRTSILNRVIDDLQHKFGLSEFGIGSETITSQSSRDVIQSKSGSSITTKSAFVVGKYLTPKIYIGYSMGLLDPFNIFRVRYILNKRWSVQSESSTFGNGGDLILNIGE